jgi:prepilin-type N-terminal cleavage/methylation domain-containing protein
MRKGFTVVELLTCVAIIGVISALAFPAFASAQRKGLVTQTTSNLHQIQVAAELYRQGESGVQDFGSASDMGLPTLEHMILAEKRGRAIMPPMYSAASLWRAPCGVHPSMPKDPWIQWMVGEEGDWAGVSRHLQARSPLAVSLQCTDSNVEMSNRYQPKRLMAVQLDGTLINRTTDGNPLTLLYWKNQ